MIPSLALCAIIDRYEPVCAPSFAEVAAARKGRGAAESPIFDKAIFTEAFSAFKIILNNP